MGVPARSAAERAGRGGPGRAARLRWPPALGLEAQRGHLFPWAPVLLGTGIGGYFLWPGEPSAAIWMVVCALGGVATVRALRRPEATPALAWAVTLFALGMALAGLRAHLVAAPVLGGRYYGPVEGRVVAIDRSASDALRLTLDRVRLIGRPPDAVPARVRIALHGAAAEGPPPVPGGRVMTTAHLAPPGGAAEPGGFDFRRHAWFLRLGGLGYSRVPVLAIAAPEGRWWLGLRLRLAARLRAALPGPAGGFAAAVTTGDRSGVAQATLDDLRASNLAHLLAISGLHMGLLSGFVFGALRLALALVPPLALRLPVRRLSSVGALAAASVYLALSGGNVATERAFVMTAVVLGGLMLDRRAFSLRAVAVAALIVLALRPESLLGPGFQMSFAATTALIAVFGALKDRGGSWRLRWLAPLAGLVISSAVAGLATAPVGAAHFNTLSRYGLIANLLAVPAMGLVVIPGAVLSAVLALVGLEDWGLRLMGLGLRWILWVAQWVAGLSGAQGHVVSPGSAVLPLLALGGLILCLWQGWGRCVGLLPMAVALTLWAGAERPEVLISEDGALVGVMTPEGRALSRASGAGFVAGIWLENDGDGADQAAAAGRWPQGEPAPGLRRAAWSGGKLLQVIGTRGAEKIDDCAGADLLIANVPLPVDGPCQVYDPPRLRALGAVALGPGGRLRRAEVSGGRRLWSPVPGRGGQ
ncbi:ComEC/Rec2 family competence protein [Pseudodonghicola flavimaris]|uniref:ComEC/Rec2 family competence protein n=1 Tax=Pseudodonghicola flavimaris TaxID=3050036 RepID=A0ABT7EVR8_9RHOB|nr:ComEC/Rec2 family competence protein [Pseudodonghicola flavimaris]MDK3016425.1 ComEC/Rec2 family competence protein [Pseudodonghicola flavimaris]